MRHLFNVIIASFVLFGCNKKKPTEAPKDWVRWTQDLEKRSKEKFAAPTITHHVYLEHPGDKAFYTQDGEYPRFQKKGCENCPVAIELTKDLKVKVNVKGMNEAVPLSFEEPSPIFNNDRIYFSAHPIKEESKVRVFIHDLKQAKLEKKRQRDFFQYLDKWKMQAQWRWLQQPKPVKIQRSDGSSKEMQKVAEVVGELDSKQISLSVFNFAGDDSYKDGNREMLLYRDFSNGKSTYGAGRFLVVEFPKKIGEMKNDDPLTVDFNYSYNPPCAVSTGFHCPLPVDMANLPIEAGEKYKKL